MQTGGEGVQGVREETAVVEPVEAEEHGTEDQVKDETPRETVARVFKELSSETEEAEEPEAEEAPEARTSTSREKKAGKRAVQQEEVIPPPNRFSAAQKEIFNSLPIPLKKELLSMVNNHEAQFTKAQRDARAAQKEAAHVIEAVRPYLLANPRLQEEGFTESKLVSSLLAAHQKLTNPKTAISTYIELGPQVGLSKEKVEKIKEIIYNGAAPQGVVADISQHPQFRDLQEKFNRISSKIESAERSTFEQEVSSIVSEMEAVRDEKDSFGRYVYPRLHDEDFLAQVKPLVSALVKSAPGLKYGAALKHAYGILNGNSGTLPQTNQTRLPQTTVRTERSPAAIASVRGRSAPAAAGELDEFPAEAMGDARSTVAWALKQLRRG